jgi:hypothetical protein
MYSVCRKTLRKIFKNSDDPCHHALLVQGPSIQSYNTRKFAAVAIQDAHTIDSKHTSAIQKLTRCSWETPKIPEITNTKAWWRFQWRRYISSPLKSSQPHPRCIKTKSLPPWESTSLQKQIDSNHTSPLTIQYATKVQVNEGSGVFWTSVIPHPVCLVRKREWAKAKECICTLVVGWN